MYDRGISLSEYIRDMGPCACSPRRLHVVLETNQIVETLNRLCHLRAV
jgi:hypothetical protein